MDKDIQAKTINPSFVQSELVKIGFDSSYIVHALEKNTFKTIKVYNLRPQEATILKQTALSLGFDACVSMGVLDCSVDISDAVLTGSLVQFEKLSEALVHQPFKMKQVSEKIKCLLKNKLNCINYGDFSFDWEKPYIMGILNITPDSFSDGGTYNNIEKAVERYLQMIDEGVDIVDIGAESTRPNHEQITPDEEIARLKPILQELRKANKNIPISVDTRNVETADLALKLGANIINDVGFCGLNLDMVKFVNKYSVPYILMHNEKIETSVVDEVFWWFKNNIDKITAPVILDVGIGFGKTVDENYELLNRIEEFKSLNFPLLVGHSRKSFLNKISDYNQIEMDEATVAISAKLLLSGVNILRVHDVKRHKILLHLLKEWQKSNSVM